MEKVFALKDVAYASDGAIGTIDRLEDIDGLAEGTLGFYSEAGDLLNATAADYVDVKDFVIAANIGGEIRITKGIERQQVFRVDTGDYVAPVYSVAIAGGTTAQTRFSIADDEVGHVGIRVADNNFSSMYATDMINATVYKKASMTAEVVVDKLVEKLNASTALNVTAARLGADASGNYGISITSTVRGQKLSISLSGLIEGDQIINDGTSASVLPVNGTGVGEDVYAHEQEASSYLGNSFSNYRGDLFFSAPMGASKATNYDTIHFQEQLRKPYIGETNVKPLYSLYIPTGAATNIKTSILAVLANLVAGAFEAATADEPGDE